MISTPECPVIWQFSYMKYVALDDMLVNWGTYWMWWAVQVINDIVIADMILMVNIAKESQMKEKLINEANWMKRQ